MERREAKASKAYDKRARRSPESATLRTVCWKLELSVDDFNGLLKDGWSFGPLGSFRKAEMDARRVLKDIASQAYGGKKNEPDTSCRLRRRRCLRDIKAKVECPFYRLVSQAAEDGADKWNPEEAIDSIVCSVGRLNEIP